MGGNTNNNNTNNNSNNNQNNNENNNDNNENNNFVEDIDNIYEVFLNFLKKEPHNKDISIYLKFLFHDIKSVRNNDISSINLSKKNITSIKDEYLNNFMNKISEFSNSNKNIYRSKSLKIIKTVKENFKKIKPFINIIDSKLKEIQASENAPNIKFSNNTDLKLKKNIFEIKEGFKYKIGELLLRFLFNYSHQELEGGRPLYQYHSQKKFYESIKNFMDNSPNQKNNLYQITPHFIYLYNYFILIENIFNEDLNLNDIYNEKKMKENIKKLYEFYKVGKDGKKGKESKKGKKGKESKKKKKKDGINRVTRSLTGGENNNDDNDNNNKTNKNNDISSNVKKDDNFKLKDSFLNILKKIKTNEQISLYDGSTTDSLYKIYNDYYLNLLKFNTGNNYFDNIIDNFPANRDKVLLDVKKEIEHPLAKDDDDSKIKIISILKNTKKSNDYITSESKKKKNNQKLVDYWKDYFKKEIDYKYKFNILQILRCNILNKDILNYLKKLNKIFLKNFLLLIKKFLLIKSEMYKEIIELNIKNSSNKINKKIIINKNLLILINGTKLNLTRYNNDKNKDIIRKISILMEEYKKLQNKYDKNYDNKVFVIQKLITKHLVQLK